MSIHEFEDWTDECRSELASWLMAAATRLVRLATDLRLPLRQLTFLQRQRDDVIRWWKDGGRCTPPELVARLGFPRSDCEQWSNIVELRVELHDIRDADGGLGRVPTARVSARVTGSTGHDPHDAIKFVLTATGTLAVTMQQELTRMLNGFKLAGYLDARKSKESKRRQKHVLFLLDNIKDHRVRAFVQNEIVPHLSDGKYVRRFEGKERRLLNSVPDAVLKVTHVRGGDSTIKPTRGLAEYIKALARREKSDR
jgi:hypothetical protein